MTQQDRFGLKKMSTNQEVAVSFTLFVLGMLVIVADLMPVTKVIDLRPTALGLVMIATSYLFAVESIRELEQKDHFLSKRLMRSGENTDED
ncbi:MAG: hypothetical protein ABEJ98_00405 [Candidatus Nanohaloarchaea archaeon]